MSVVLLVDDIEVMREQYKYDLERLGGHQVLTANNGADALVTLERETVDCMILDLEMPVVDGFEVLETLKARGSKVPVIVYTGTGNFKRCVRAVKLGAYSFIDKAEPTERVVQEVARACEKNQLVLEVTRLRRRESQESPLLGQSAVMGQLKERIARLAPIPSAVLVLGESGTGKELVARALHDEGPRAQGPFVAINCAALPEQLVESELFGHERGAFTGADKARRGAFESANGGTLFLDEVGDLPAGAQAKLLRVLEVHTVTRVGGNSPLKVDTRVVAATHRNLDAEVAEGRFREDLLYRLNVHELPVPSLAQRPDDIPLLAERFLASICQRFGMAPKQLSTGAMDSLCQRSYERNNVRELRNLIERMIIATDDDLIDGVPTERPRPTGDAQAAADDAGGSFKDRKAKAEKAIVLAALARHHWQITRTAAELELADHASLLKIMRRHGITKPS